MFQTVQGWGTGYTLIGLLCLSHPPGLGPIVPIWLGHLALKNKKPGHKVIGDMKTLDLEEYSSHALNSNNIKDKYSVLIAHCVPCIIYGISKLPSESGYSLYPHFTNEEMKAQSNEVTNPSSSGLVKGIA